MAVSSATTTSAETTTYGSDSAADGCERGAVGVDRVQGGGRGDVIARHERQPVGAGHLRALPLAAAEYPRRQRRPLAGHGVHVESSTR